MTRTQANLNRHWSSQFFWWDVRAIGCSKSQWALVILLLLYSSIRGSSTGGRRAELSLKSWTPPDDSGLITVQYHLVLYHPTTITLQCFWGHDNASDNVERNRTFHLWVILPLQYSSQATWLDPPSCLQQSKSLQSLVPYLVRIALSALTL